MIDTIRSQTENLLALLNILLIVLTLPLIAAVVGRWLLQQRPWWRTQTYYLLDDGTFLETVPSDRVLFAGRTAATVLRMVVRIDVRLAGGRRRPQRVAALVVRRGWIGREHRWFDPATQTILDHDEVVVLRDELARRTGDAWERRSAQVRALLDARMSAAADSASGST